MRERDFSYVSQYWVRDLPYAEQNMFWVLMVSIVLTIYQRKWVHYYVHYFLLDSWYMFPGRTLGIKFSSVLFSKLEAISCLCSLVPNKFSNFFLWFSSLQWIALTFFLCLFKDLWSEILKGGIKGPEQSNTDNSQFFIVSEYSWLHEQHVSVVIVWRFQG